MDILDDMGVSKLSAFFNFFKVNYSFKHSCIMIFSCTLFYSSCTWHWRLLSHKCNTHSSWRETRPSNSPFGISVIWFPYRTLKTNTDTMQIENHESTHNVSICVTHVQLIKRVHSFYLRVAFMFKKEVAKSW